MLGDKEYAALLYAQCGHGTFPSAVQQGMKVQLLDLLQILYGTANHYVIRSLAQPLPVDIVSQAPCLYTTVDSTPWLGPI